MTRQRFSLWQAVALLFFPAIGASPSSAALLVLGPGPIATPFDQQGYDEYEVVPGTQFVATATRLTPDGKSLLGGKAIFAYSSTWTFDGGLVEGATVTTQAGVEYAGGGTAIDLYSPSS